MSTVFDDVNRVKRESLAHEVLSKAEIYALITTYQTAPNTPAGQREKRAAQEKIINHNLKLVQTILNKFKYPYSSGISEEDLFQEGILGIIWAIERFDTSKGVEFSTYATNWVYQKISRYAMSNDSNVRIPVHIKQASGQIKRYIDKCHKQGKPTPNPEQISHHLNEVNSRRTSMLVIKTALGCIHNNNEQSLDEPRRLSNGDDAGTWYDAIEVPDTAPRLAEMAELRDCMTDALMQLEPRKSTIMKMRHGIGEFDGVKHTLEVIGDRFGITRERIRQLEREAERELKQILGERGRSLL